MDNGITPEGLESLANNDRTPETLAGTLERIEQENEIRTGELLGIGFEGFERFTRYTDGLQDGLYLILARTNIGKTAFLSALVNSLVKNLIDRPAVMVFSLDDSKEDFIYRLLTQRTGLMINSIKQPNRKTSGKDTLNDDEKKTLKDEYAHLKEESKRLSVFDIDTITHPEKNAFDVFERLVRNEHARLNGSKFVLCIDGLHNLDTGEGENTRAENITRASKVKELADTLKIPIVCTVETRKDDNKKTTGHPPDKGLDDIMESGKYAFNANVVFALNTIDPAKEKHGIDKPEMLLKLSFVKNKRSGYKGNLFFRFDSKPKEWIEDGEKVEEHVKTTLKECTRQEQKVIEGKTPASGKETQALSDEEKALAYKDE